METSDKVLLVLLLLAFAALPVAGFLYLRTAYRQGGWRQVKVAAGLAASALLAWGAFRLWVDWEADHLRRVLEHPFALGSVLFVLLMWLLHWVLTMRNEETDVRD